MSVGDREEQLRKQIAGKVCSACSQVPTVAWERCLANNGVYVLRCGCYPQAPTLVRRPGRQQTRVLGGQYPQPVDREALDGMTR